MSEQKIQPARRLEGAVRTPGDKSISHRYALLCALAEGTSTLANFSSGADCHSTLACMRALGVETTEKDGEVEIHGVGLRGLRAPAGPLDAGNSGSTLRMLAGILAAQPFASVIGGDRSLNQRPMKRIIEPLNAMGAKIASVTGDGRPPLKMEPVNGAGGGGLRGIEYTLPVASAQVKSAILFAGLYAHGTTTVIEPRPSRDHSEIALRQMGTPVRARSRRIEIDGPVEKLNAVTKYRIPGDPSSAAFFLCGAAMLADSNLLVDEVSLNPRRAALLDVLRRMGAALEVVSVEDREGELAGSLNVSGKNGRLRGTRIEGDEAVALIDEVPILAVLATAAEGGIEFCDVGELRVKESDRLAAIAANLRAMGAECTESQTGLTVPGPQRLRGARIASHDDHRIAMAFSMAALRAEGECTIEGAECVGISYPEFYQTLERVAER